MIVGCPKEIKAQEHRVGLVPASVRDYVRHGHTVLVESGAGAGIDFPDAAYQEAGAEICATAAEIFKRADMIVKVKEPQLPECAMMRPGQVLFTYLHLAADPAQARALLESGCVAVAYETVTGRGGRGLPLLAPMSEVAGRLAVVAGSFYMQKHKGGQGRLLCGVPGVMPGRVMVIGGGVAGLNAARVAAGMGADVTILERDHDRLRFLDDYFHGQARVLYSSADMLEKIAPDMDMIVGSVLIPGASAPKLVTKAMLKTLRPGTVLVDIAIDQGGCFETSRPTTHDDPVYTVDGIVHYCVANMPGAVPLSSALALNHAVLPYGLALVDRGWKDALRADPGLRAGLNVCAGEIVYESVARALDLPFNPEPAALAA